MGAVQFFVALAIVSTLNREEAVSLNSTILAVDWKVAQLITHSINVHTAKINPLAAFRAVISLMRQCSSPSNVSECSEVKFASSSNTQVLLTLEFHHLSILNMIRMTRPHDTYLNVTLFLKSSTLECL